LKVVDIDPSAAFGAFAGIGLAVAFEVVVVRIEVVAGIAPSVASEEIVEVFGTLAVAGVMAVSMVVGSFWIEGGIQGN
jgi:hypothetical protein